MFILMSLMPARSLNLISEGSKGLLSWGSLSLSSGLSLRATRNSSRLKVPEFSLLKLLLKQESLARLMSKS